MKFRLPFSPAVGASVFLALTMPVLRPAEPAKDPKSSPAEEDETRIAKECAASIEKLSRLLKENPDNISLLSSRGDAFVFAGRWKEARADFEKTIALDPAQDAPHWRLGIVYFLLGEYAKGAEQFAKYHAYDAHDRENGVWHYFCLAKVEGADKARTKMLEYKAFDRHPFPSLYDMLAGKKSAAEVMEEIEKSEASAAEKEHRWFFAELYIGMNEWLSSGAVGALPHLEKAVANRWGREVSGQTYMWQVARLLRNEWSRQVKRL